MRPLALGSALFALALAVSPARPADEPAAPKGLRVFSAGHSFHVFVPGVLTDIAKGAGIKDHKHLGTSSIGGSRTIQHWDQPDDKNKTKAALKEGTVDVLTLAPIYHPDAGVDNFVKLALEHNPNVRVTVQASWLPYDVYDPDYQKKRPEKVDRNARTVAELKALHLKYSAPQDEQVAEINKRHGKAVAFVVPVGQAAIRLRGRIIDGKAPGLKTQEELFVDPIGHATEPLRVLNAYCHYAVLYKRSPVGLPVPAGLKSAKNPAWNEKLNAVLQEVAWEAVTAHPLSGVTADTKK